ncbi:LVIVD repeat-containing protein [Micromonospora coxensis]|uniref:LVIVD repeat-containing protein n=1 Tax=Micromonospora coxensis TaxID=356852 RepID=A0A1C5H5Z3_9ACTN|nr:LVIVD repeat-containing protein [Micromonospora coxensis]
MIRFPLPGRRQLKIASMVATGLLVAGVATVPAQAAATPDAEAAVASTATQPVATSALGVDEISSSPNLRQIANLPKQAPFDTAGAFGTDMAFQGRYAFVGNYNGFVIYDIGRPAAPKIVSQVLCPGSQNDISIYGNLLFLSTDSSRSDDSCASVAQSASVKESWEGIKVFDISDKANPRYVKSVETACGSHTHTLVPAKDRRTVYLYVSSYSPRAEFPDCQPPHDSISIVKVPVKKPTEAAVVATPNLFPDGGYAGIPGQASATSGCHDITAYPAKDIAAGACMGDGVLLDIRDREAPRVINRVRDTVNFAFWHSATFNNAGTKVVFTDELGGGGAATCNETVGPNRGADAIYDITGRGDARQMVFRSYYKIPRTNADTENCVAHNGSLVPVFGRDIMVQAWYQGGVSVWDFTDSAKPKEIGFWERGPLSDTQLSTGGAWSTYYYNGHIYSSDIQKGLDVLELNDWRTWTANLVRFRELNVQTQAGYLSW